jgi:LysM repeat protein
MSVASYVVVAGDTVDLVASKNGLSSDTIKWANNLLLITLTVGTILKILPVDGVLYTVKSSDTVDSIASRYQVDAYV